MRLSRGRLSKKARSDMFSMQAEPVPPIINSVTTHGTPLGSMSDEVYYHHWSQMINIWPYL